MKYKKILILLLILLSILIINSSSANENITIEINDELPEIDNTTPAIYITKDNPNYATLNTDEFNVEIKKDNNEPSNLPYKIINITPKNSSIKSNPQFKEIRNFNYEFTKKNNSYIYSGLISTYRTYNIYKSYYDNTILFKLYYYPNKNFTEIIQPDNLYRLTPNGELYYGDVQILSGFEFDSKYVKKLYISHNNTFELETYPYTISFFYNYNGMDIYDIWQGNDFHSIKLPENEKVVSNNSTDGWFKIDIYKKIDDYRTVKSPIYESKKVRDGYKWKYYKTKWYKKKIVTHKWKKGKFIVYHNKLRKVKNLIQHNGKIIKTVYTSKKRTVYLKYPVDFYKKVKKYKYVENIVGYDSIKYYDGFHYEFDKTESRKLI